MRTIVTIPDNQIKEIEALCHEQHISRAELIRLSLSSYIKSYRAAPRNKDKAFGILKSSGIDGIKHQDQLRSEWD
jgi:metal-responsive CopG/Arc/MetJ family transcriptional regulator